MPVLFASQLVFGMLRARLRCARGNACVHVERAYRGVTNPITLSTSYSTRCQHRAGYGCTGTCSWLGNDLNDVHLRLPTATFGQR